MKSLLLIVAVLFGQAHAITQAGKEIDIATAIATSDPNDVGYFCDQQFNISLVLLYINFDPADELIVLGNANITTDSPDGYEVNRWWTNKTPPPEAFLPVKPEIICSTYASLGMRTKPAAAPGEIALRDCTTFTPDFKMGNGTINGGWFCTPPFEGTSAIGTHILAAQFAIKTGYSVGGEFDVFWDKKGERTHFSFHVDTGTGHTIQNIEHTLHLTTAPTTAPPIPEGYGKIGATVGATIGVILLLVIGIIAACVVRKKRNFSKAQATALGSTTAELASEFSQ